MTCPHCGKALEAGAARWRPFCSERCKLADLGGWFAERYTIPADPDLDAPAERPAPESHKPRQ